METLVCPKGHNSTEPDYCSECGARLEGAAAAEAGAPAAAASAEHCPECGAARDQPGIVFCEICGYNFETGARGSESIVTAVPLTPAPPVSSSTPASTPPAVAATQAKHWEVVISADPSLRDPQSPEVPQGMVPLTVALTAPVSLIGRRSQARAIYPEIDLSHDDAVSHRHALLQMDAAGQLTLRDIGAANGTQLNGRMVEPLKDHPLAAGDAITLGHWSRLILQAAD